MGIADRLRALADILEKYEGEPLDVHGRALGAVGIIISGDMEWIQCAASVPAEPDFYGRQREDFQRHAAPAKALADYLHLRVHDYCEPAIQAQEN